MFYKALFEFLLSIIKIVQVKTFVFGRNMKLENMDTRWNRIEKKHINAVKLGHRNEAASDICKNLLKNRNFIRDHHMKYLLGDKGNNWYLDPNLVMDLRHEKVYFYSFEFTVSRNFLTVYTFTTILNCG